MRKAARPLGGMESSNPRRWWGKRLHHHGGDVGCVFVLLWMDSWHHQLNVCKKWYKNNLMMMLTVLLSAPHWCAPYLWFSYSGHPGSIMWFVTDWIRGDGNSLRQQSSEFPLVNISILTASFYKHCCWERPSDIRSMRVRCSWGSEAPIVLVSPYLEMLDSDLKVSCLLLIQQSPTQRFNCCTLDWWPLVKSSTRSIAKIDPCIADSPENLLPL